MKMHWFVRANAGKQPETINSEGIPRMHCPAWFHLPGGPKCLAYGVPRAIEIDSKTALSSFQSQVWMKKQS